MAKSPSVALRVDLNRARAHWHRQQGLAPHPPAPLEAILARHGWGRTLGGVDVYLAIRARLPEMRRADLDRAVEDHRIQVVPAVRGCIYLVPGRDVPNVLRVAEEQYRKRSDRDREKVGIPLEEIETLGNAVLEALRSGPLTTEGIRAALPPGTVRKLGPEAKKIGVSSPLPIALRHLEFEGRIERTPVGGRLDTQYYFWRIPAVNPFDRVTVSADSTERLARIAHSFLEWTGPVTIKDFAEWAAASQKEARAAFERAGGVPVAIDGVTEEAWVLEAHLPTLREPAVPVETVSFLATEDLYLTAHGGPRVLVDPGHHDRPIYSWGSTGRTTLGEARHVGERALLVGDQLAGMWEFDLDAGNVVWGTFGPMSSSVRQTLEREASALTTFIREELGHARSFSLDTDADVRRRAGQVKELAAEGT